MSTDNEEGRARGTGRGRDEDIAYYPRGDYEGGDVADYTPENAVSMITQDQLNQLRQQNPGIPAKTPEAYYTWLFGPGKVVPSSNPTQDPGGKYFAPNSGDVVNTLHPVPSWNPADPLAMQLVRGGLMAAGGYGLSTALGPMLPSFGGNNLATGALKSAATGGIMSGLQGGNPVSGAAKGALGGVVSGGINGLDTADSSWGVNPRNNGVNMDDFTGANYDDLAMELSPEQWADTWGGLNEDGSVDWGRFDQADPYDMGDTNSGFMTPDEWGSALNGGSSGGLSDVIKKMLGVGGAAGGKGALGGLPSWALPALAGGLLLDNPDRTQTSEVRYPDWYNEGAKGALSQADKFAALGPDSVAPLSENENAAIQMAKDSSGVWRPILDKADATLDSSKQYFDQAGALAGSVPGYLNKAEGQINAAMPYFNKSGAMADTVSGYLDRSGTLANEAAGGIPSIDLSAYMNPYLDNVLNPIKRRNEIAKAGALQDINAKAGMRGAFGGSRNDLLTNLTSESADRNLNEAEANIRGSAFTTGLGAAQTDLARKLAASGQFGALGQVANTTAGTYGNIGKSIADTAGTFNNSGVVATSGANANTNIGRSLTDSASGYRANAGALGTLTDADIARLTSTGGTSRAVEQAKRNAPLTAIGGYAAALRGAGNPGSTSTTTLPEASKFAQGAGALAALVGANKQGLFS